MSAVLPLSICTWWMLNSSTLSMITSGSSWGCLMLQLSLSEKTISSSSLLGIVIRGSGEWTLFIIFSWDFFKDFSVLPTINPLEIVFISLAGGLLSPSSQFLSLSSFRWYL